MGACKLRTRCHRGAVVGDACATAHRVFNAGLNGAACNGALTWRYVLELVGIGKTKGAPIEIKHAFATADLITNQAMPVDHAQAFAHLLGNRAIDWIGVDGSRVVLHVCTVAVVNHPMAKVGIADVFGCARVLAFGVIGNIRSAAAS